MLAIRRYEPADAGRLLTYWRKAGADVPFFFDVSEERWHRSLVRDERAGERVFKQIETTFVTEGEKVLGFVQYGEPRFAWGTNGQRVCEPHIGVLRQLYFERGRADAGQALMGQADAFLARFRRNYAFYHALGMSCTAYHGKLHSSLWHVEAVLRNRGYGVEHENVYYALDLRRVEPGGDGLQLESARDAEGERFRARLDGQEIGSARVISLDRLTGGRTLDTAYLTWIGVDEGYRGLGLGTRLLRALAGRLRSRGITYLHTDTAGDNLTAQRFYQRRGFDSRGLTRSYIRDSEDQSLTLVGTDGR